MIFGGNFLNIPFKFWEIELSFKHNEHYFKFNIEFSKEVSHAGFYFDLIFFNFKLHIEINDHRHWDKDKKCFTFGNTSEDKCY